MVSLTRGAVSVGASTGNEQCIVPSVGNTGPVEPRTRISPRIQEHNRIAANEGISEDLELLAKAKGGPTTTSKETEVNGFSLPGSPLPGTGLGQIARSQARENTKANTKVDRT
jgi:hypothetical protein